MVSGGSPTALLAQDSPALDQIANEAVSFWERPEVQDWLVERPVRIAIILLVATIFAAVITAASDFDLGKTITDKIKGTIGNLKMKE